MITPRLVAAFVGGACLVGLAWAAVESGGSIPAGGESIPTLIALGLMVLGLLVLGAGIALRLRGPSSNEAPSRDPTFGEAEVRALLERWYPEWNDRYRARVAAAICYHRRRRGSV